MRIGLSGWGREVAFEQAGASPQAHRDFMSVMAEADRLGFDSVWFAELHFQREELPYPDPLLLAAAVLARTERLRVGASVLVLPLHHPMILAEQIAQLDRMSGGRVDVGIGRGSVNPRTYAVLGVDPETTRERFQTAYELLVRAWTEPTVSHDGPFWRFADVEVGPPVQQPHPPIYVAGYTAETVRFTLERRLALLLSIEPPEERQLALLRPMLAAAGLPFPTLRLSYTRYVCIGRTRREADALVDDLLPRLHERRRNFARQRGQDPDALERRSRERFLAEQAIAGTPEECIAQIQNLALAQRCSHLRCIFNGGGELDLPATLAGITLFGREVLPACQAIKPAAPPPSPPSGLPPSPPVTPRGL
jgi:alkanesulfonate monooxygenase SsuD/methylene tetrahydromethanopterin reductase-like flavin-dependent oxidoreductase (luciferase family)